MPNAAEIVRRLRKVHDDKQLVREVYEVFAGSTSLANTHRVAYSVMVPLHVLLFAFSEKYFPQSGKVRPRERDHLRSLVPLFVNALFEEHPAVAQAVNAFYASSPALLSI